jgi:hypothetical protein
MSSPREKSASVAIVEAFLSEYKEHAKKFLVDTLDNRKSAFPSSTLNQSMCQIRGRFWWTHDANGDGNMGRDQGVVFTIRASWHFEFFNALAKGFGIVKVAKLVGLGVGTAAKLKADIMNSADWFPAVSFQARARSGYSRN